MAPITEPSKNYETDVDWQITVNKREKLYCVEDRSKIFSSGI